MEMCNISIDHLENNVAYSLASRLVMRCDFPVGEWVAARVGEATKLQLHRHNARCLLRADLNPEEYTC